MLFILFKAKSFAYHEGIWGSGGMPSRILTTTLNESKWSYLHSEPSLPVNGPRYSLSRRLAERPELLCII